MSKSLKYFLIVLLFAVAACSSHGKDHHKKTIEHCPYKKAKESCAEGCNKSCNKVKEYESKTCGGDCSKNKYTCSGK